ncbi:hypothetical protein OPV22_006090 [Ensete ventricosum]|uniref:Uncharacterized protein n=1 Tax=Ensete ventricosum TaxID=4639 RepID=A0AAV8RS51_ENSVE|nr:hypothetical protein OPV22_006090 [Ensete ventricosum]
MQERKGNISCFVTAAALMENGMQLYGTPLGKGFCYQPHSVGHQPYILGSNRMICAVFRAVCLHSCGLYLYYAFCYQISSNY